MHWYFKGNPRNYTALCNWISFVLIHTRKKINKVSVLDLGGGCRGCAPPPPTPGEMTCGFLIQLVFCKKKTTMWFIGVEVEQETSAPPPKKNPGSAPEYK